MPIRSGQGSVLPDRASDSSVTLIFPIGISVIPQPSDFRRSTATLTWLNQSHGCRVDRKRSLPVSAQANVLITATGDETCDINQTSTSSAHGDFFYAVLFAQRGRIIIHMGTQNVLNPSFRFFAPFSATSKAEYTTRQFTVWHII